MMAKNKGFAAVQDGFVPNSFQVPNAFIDKYMPYLSGDEIIVWLFMCRHILGWRHIIKERRRKLSLRMISDGFGGFQGCGLSVPTIAKSLVSLTKFGLLLKVDEPDNDGQMWEIPSKEDEIDLAALKQRKAEARVAAQVKMGKVRKPTKKNEDSIDEPPAEALLNTEKDGVTLPNAEILIKQKNWLAVAEQWWNEVGSKMWQEMAAPKLGLNGNAMPGRLNLDWEHRKFASLLESNLRDGTISLAEITARYHNFLQSENSYYVERSYALAVFVDDFRNLLRANHATRNGFNGAHRSGILKPGPNSRVSAGSTIGGIIAKNTRPPIQKCVSEGSATGRADIEKDLPF